MQHFRLFHSVQTSCSPHYRQNIQSKATRASLDNLLHLSILVPSSPSSPRLRPPFLVHSSSLHSLDRKSHQQDPAPPAPAPAYFASYPPPRASTQLRHLPLHTIPPQCQRSSTPPSRVSQEATKAVHHLCLLPFWFDCIFSHTTCTSVGEGSVQNSIRSRSADLLRMQATPVLQHGTLSGID